MRALRAAGARPRRFRPCDPSCDPPCDPSCEPASRPAVRVSPRPRRALPPTDRRRRAPYPPATVTRDICGRSPPTPSPAVLHPPPSPAARRPPCLAGSDLPASTPPAATSPPAREPWRPACTMWPRPSPSAPRRSSTTTSSASSRRRATRRRATRPPCRPASLPVPRPPPIAPAVLTLTLTSHHQRQQCQRCRDAAPPAGPRPEPRRGPDPDHQQQSHRLGPRQPAHDEPPHAHHRLLGHRPVRRPAPARPASYAPPVPSPLPDTALRLT